MPSAASSRRARSSTALVQRRLLLRQSALGAHFGLLGQVGDDGRIGLQPPQDVRPHEPPQRAERLRVLLLVQPLDELLELRGGAQQAGTAEIEQRPQIAQMVFDRRAGEHDPARGGQLLDAAA